MNSQLFYIPSKALLKSIRSNMIKVCIILLSVITLNATAQSHLKTMLFKQFKVIGDNPIGNDAYEILKPNLGQHSIISISKASTALEQAIKERGFGFHRVNLPPQDLKDGKVTLEIVSFKIGKITVKNNHFFSHVNIKNSIPNLIKGTSPNTEEISNAIKFANKHPNKHIAIEFTDGNKNGGKANTIDSTFHVLESDPELTYISLENNGSNETKALRLSLSYQNNNFMDKDHQVSLQYTTAPENTKSTQQFIAKYQIPFYSDTAHLTTLFAESESNTGSLSDDSLVTGRGSLFYIDYAHQLESKNIFEHKVSFGLQYKLFDDEIFGNNQYTLSTPILFNYYFSNTKKSQSLKGNIGSSFNIGGAKYNDDESYELARTGAKANWGSIHYSLSWDYHFSKQWTFLSELTGQKSSRILIPGEQFTVGGMRTLRGFEEGSINGDSGIRYRLEIWAPPFLYDISYALFYDAAKIEKNESTAAANDGYKLNLASTGLALKWHWKDSLSLTTSISKINSGGGPDTSINQDGDQKLHVNMIYKF